MYQNFAYILEKKAHFFPDDIAVVEADTGKEYSYRDLCGRAKRLANALQGMKVRKGDRILAVMRNRVEYLDILFGVARVGAMVVPVNYRLSPPEILAIIDDASPQVVFFDPLFSEKIKSVKEKAKGIQSFVALGDTHLDGVLNYEDVLRQYPGESTQIQGQDDDYVLMLYTAGSTGRPKGVPLKNSNLFYNSINWIIDIGITRKDRTLTVLPFYHIGGHILFTLSHLHVGGRVVLQSQFEAVETLNILQGQKITNTFLLPAMLKRITQIPDWDKYDISCLRFIGAGGEPVPEKVTRAFAEIGIGVFNAYGLTETTDGTTFLRMEHAGGKPAHCIGKTLTHVDMKIVDGQGKELGPGQEGEIMHRGPTVVESYWNRAEETSKTFRDGWFLTGDLATMDDDGFIYFLGRKDDMIISGGENIYPAEVEGVIYSHPKVADVAVIGVPDEQWGEVAKAVIELREGESLTGEEVISHVKEQLASFKKPRIIQFVDKLPKTGPGKLDRVQIKQIYGGRK